MLFDGAKLFEVAAIVSGLFHALDGHFEGLAGGGGIALVVKLVGEEEEALEAGFGLGGIAGDVGLDVEGDWWRWC